MVISDDLIEIVLLPEKRFSHCVGVQRLLRFQKV